MHSWLMRAIVLRMVALAVLGGAMCAMCPAVLRAQTPQAAKAPEVEPVLATLMALQNQERSRAGLPALTMDTRLMQAAQIQAQYMARSNQATHQGRNGTTPAQRVQQQGYRAIRVAENVANGQATAEDVLQAWLHSPAHRQNILGPFAEIGTARATSTDGVPYWCAVFGLLLPTLDPGSASAEVVMLLNQQRTTAGLSPLKAPLQLAEVARVQAQAMAERPAPQGQKRAAGPALAQLQQAGYRYHKISQSTISGAPTPMAVVQELMNNPASKERLLGDFIQVGVGYAMASDGTPYWNILLGLP